MAHINTIERAKKLRQQCKLSVCFEHEGRWYLGNPSKAIQNFIKQNPNPADFGYWLQDNCKEINI